MKLLLKIFSAIKYNNPVEVAGFIISIFNFETSQKSNAKKIIIAIKSCIFRKS